LGTLFAPLGCVSFVKDPANLSVTFTLTNCSGIWGLARVSGVLVATYATITTPAGAPALQVDVDGHDLKLRAAKVSYHARAIVTGTGLARAMDWDGTLNGTTARGRPFDRSAKWTVEWTIGQSCIKLNGSAVGELGGRVIQTSVSNYQRCRGECPQA